MGRGDWLTEPDHVTERNDSFIDLLDEVSSQSCMPPSLSGPTFESSSTGSLASESADFESLLMAGLVLESPDFGPDGNPFEKSNNIRHSHRWCEVLADCIHQVSVENSWMDEFHDDIYYGTPSLGAFVRQSDEQYVRTTHDYTVLGAVERIGPALAVTFSSNLVTTVIKHATLADQTELCFDDGFVLDIIDSVEDITAADDLAESLRQPSGAYLCRREHFVLVWAVEGPELYNQVADLEKHLSQRIRGVGIPLAPSVAPDFFTMVRRASLPAMSLSKEDLTPTSSPPQRRSSHLQDRLIPRFTHSQSPPTEPPAPLLRGLKKSRSPMRSWFRRHGTDRSMSLDAVDELR